MTAAGDLRQRIDIEHRVEVENSLGEKVKDWAVRLSQIAAAAYPLRGREMFLASQFGSEATVRFRIRYRAGLDATMRVVWKNTFYAIAADPINVDGGSEWIDLYCKSGIKDGR